MLIDNPATLIASCAAGAAFLNLAIIKLSPDLGRRARHLLAGIGPAAASLGVLIGPNDSVVATGSDLAALGAMTLAGLAAAVGSTRFVTPRKAIPRD